MHLLWRRIQISKIHLPRAPQCDIQEIDTSVNVQLPKGTTRSAECIKQWIKRATRKYIEYITQLTTPDPLPALQPLTRPPQQITTIRQPQFQRQASKQLLALQLATAWIKGHSSKLSPQTTTQFTIE